MDMEKNHIVGRLAECERYFSLNPHFSKAFAFLKRPDLAELPPGRYDIDGSSCWANVQEATLKDLAERRLEAHRRYIDIQSPITGPETIGLAEMDAAGAEMEHTEEFVETIRAIRGVEMSAFLRETEDGIRVSLRSKNKADVGAIAQHFGGGGHVKAAGCTIHEPLLEAFEMVRAEMIRSLEALQNDQS